MSREPQKARVDTVDADTTNNSELVLDLVMSYLPLKNCVRTSILSSKWRYRWTTIPSLVFDPKDCCPRSCRYRSTEEQSKALTNFINRFLLLHTGSIQVFQVRELCAVPDIDSWILRLSKDSIKTLVLDVRYSSQYQIPSSLFDCGSLSSLKLTNCLLMPPPSSFKGFKDLKCLNLLNVTLTDDAFEKLISSSPLLEKLTLEPRGMQYQLPSILRLPLSFKGFKTLKSLELRFVTLSNDAFEELISSCHLLENLALHKCVASFQKNELEEANKLKINAPNLQDIYIYDGFTGITFGYAMTRLSRICINSSVCRYADLLDSFIKLPNIQQLEVKECDEWFTSEDSILKDLPFQCKDLCHLAVNISLSIFEDDESFATLYIYRGPPNFTEPGSECWDRYFAIEVGVWEDNSIRHHEFKQLRRLRMNDFLGTEKELQFLEFVLGNSPVLEEMAVNAYSDTYRHPPLNVVDWKDIRSIYEFKRASKPKIIFDGLVTQIC